MKRIVKDLTVGFGLTFFLVSSGFLVLLPHQTPHTVRLEAAYALTMLLVFVVTSALLARRMLRPVLSLSEQLDKMDPHNINRKVWISDQTPELRHLTDQINDLLSRVHIALVDLNQYSAQVAHELRTPLTVIRLKIEQAAEKIDSQLAEELETELTRLTLQVERALLLARAEQGRLPLHRSLFDLQGALADIAEGFRLLAAEEGRDIHLRTKAATIDADPSYTKQILYNLLSNALRHGQGTIHAHVKRQEHTTTVVVGNRVKPIPMPVYNLGFGQRIMEALSALHGNLHISYRQRRFYYIATLQVKETSKPLVHAA